MRRGRRAGSNVIRLTPWRRRRYRRWLGAGLVLLLAAMWLETQVPATGGGESLVITGVPGSGTDASGAGILDEVMTVAAGVIAPSPPDLSWTTILGSAGNLRAVVSDGASVWWVREGDELAGDWRVTRIAARPPGVTLSHDEAGHHALPFDRELGATPRTGQEEQASLDGSARVIDGGSAGAIGGVVLSGSARAIDGDTLEVRGTLTASTLRRARSAVARRAGRVAVTSMLGWGLRDGRWHTAGIRWTTPPRSVRHGPRSGACGRATSSRPGTGAAARAWRASDHHDGY